MLPLLVRVDDTERHQSVQYAFEVSPVRLGRNPLNDVCLDSGFVSQWHATVRFDETVTEFIDLGSTNGTLVRGERAPKNEPVAVTGNVEIAIGHLRVYCWRAPAPAHAFKRPDLDQMAVGGETESVQASKTLVAEFARTLSDQLRVGSASDAEQVLSHVSLAMQTFARAFVELRRGYEQFGTEMAIGTMKDTPLEHAKQPGEVLHYLVDPTADANQRIEELKRSYADIMLHQVALLGAMMEGVRTLLSRLSPEAIEDDVKGGGPFRTGKLWSRFVELHREFTEEDNRVTAAVFGNEFARAYAAVVGDDGATEPGPGGRARTRASEPG